MKCYRFGVVIATLALLVVASIGGFQSAVAEGQKSDSEKLETVLQISRQFAAKYPGAVEVAPAEAMAMFEKGEAVFVDVRGAQETAVSMLPGAVTREAFEKNPGIAEGKTAVAYCTIGVRSGGFSQKMNRKGTRVLSLSGGVLAWLLEGGKVYHAGEETNKVHVYGDAWNYLPEGYEASTGGR